jgi:hypothetical protein
MGQYGIACTGLSQDAGAMRARREHAVSQRAAAPKILVRPRGLFSLTFESHSPYLDIGFIVVPWVARKFVNGWEVLLVAVSKKHLREAQLVADADRSVGIVVGPLGCIDKSREQVSLQLGQLVRTPSKPFSLRTKHTFQQVLRGHAHRLRPFVCYHKIEAKKQPGMQT